MDANWCFLEDFLSLAANTHTINSNLSGCSQEMETQKAFSDQLNGWFSKNSTIIGWEVIEKLNSEISVDKF